uniref:Uncharacterized protein n=1 Tax=Compsopogon caeruleus TaxID=31354 RepID=A0A7S1TEV7_9RHOD|mmetsp:Transcript_3362/g.6318  ORF Transcript_3362/g.6318 Transcript_3362/m.6318 type:complete len:106 (+) Transcript_3362:107-424(+)
MIHFDSFVGTVSDEWVALSPQIRSWYLRDNKRKALFHKYEDVVKLFIVERKCRGRKFNPGICQGTMQLFNSLCRSVKIESMVEGIYRFLIKPGALSRDDRMKESP